MEHKLWLVIIVRKRVLNWGAWFTIVYYMCTF